MNKAVLAVPAVLGLLWGANAVIDSFEEEKKEKARIELQLRLKEERERLKKEEEERVASIKAEEDRRRLFADNVNWLLVAKDKDLRQVISSCRSSIGAPDKSEGCMNVWIADYSPELLDTMQAASLAFGKPIGNIGGALYGDVDEENFGRLQRQKKQAKERDSYISFRIGYVEECTHDSFGGVKRRARPVYCTYQEGRITGVERGKWVYTSK